MSWRREGRQTVGSIMGGGAPCEVEAATIELLSLDGFGMSVGRTTATARTLKGTWDIKGSA